MSRSTILMNSFPTFLRTYGRSFRLCVCCIHVGGILTLEFEEDGTLEFLVTAEETDYLFDEIGSVLKIKQYQMEKRDLLEALEMYYRVFYLGEEIDEEEES
jgi:hypothetical protein